MGDVIILLGSNIEPAINIRRGAYFIASKLPLWQVSSVWLTPVIGPKGPDFYNAAVSCSTELDAETLKYSILRPIEKQMGRIRTADKYAPRTIDLDAILLNGIVLEPRLWDTAFILLPVAELMPDLQNPITNVNLRKMAESIQPTSGASRISDFSLFE
jgi:2-amino-4-hydroxy-6-hydroxymethyldihydropteridine diphosphokinase